MKYSVIFIFLFLVSGCASREPVSYDADVAQAMPESKALEVLHQHPRPHGVEFLEGSGYCLFSSDDVKSMKTGDSLQYQKLALGAVSDWGDPGTELWRIEIVRIDSGKVFCKYSLGAERSNSQGRAKALEFVSRIATAWVAMGGKIEEH